MGSPGSRAWRFRTCTGSLTARGPPTARDNADDDVAFRTYHSVGTPNSLISRLNGWPARAPVNASLRPHGSPTHHSGSPWIATPSV
jgi:hypothetical protein